MSQTIYVVTSGSYSDYGVRAMFSDRAKAEAYCAWQNGPDDRARPYDVHSVEEWTLDELFKPEGQFAWTEHLYKPQFEGDEYPRWEPRVDRSERIGLDSYEPNVSFMGYGETAEHARRSAAELKRQWQTDVALRKQTCDAWRKEPYYAEHAALIDALETGSKPTGAP